MASKDTRFSREGSFPEALTSADPAITPSAVHAVTSSGQYAFTSPSEQYTITRNSSRNGLRRNSSRSDVNESTGHSSSSDSLSNREKSLSSRQASDESEDVNLINRKKKKTRRYKKKKKSLTGDNCESEVSVNERPGSSILSHVRNALKDNRSYCVCQTHNIKCLNAACAHRTANINKEDNVNYKPYDTIYDKKLASTSRVNNETTRAHVHAKRAEQRIPGEDNLNLEHQEMQKQNNNGPHYSSIDNTDVDANLRAQSVCVKPKGLNARSVTQSSGISSQGLYASSGAQSTDMNSHGLYPHSQSNSSDTNPSGLCVSSGAQSLTANPLRMYTFSDAPVRSSNTLTPSQAAAVISHATAVTSQAPVVTSQAAVVTVEDIYQALYHAAWKSVLASAVEAAPKLNNTTTTDSFVYKSAYDNGPSCSIIAHAANRNDIVVEACHDATTPKDIVIEAGNAAANRNDIAVEPGNSTPGGSDTPFEAYNETASKDDLAIMEMNSGKDYSDLVAEHNRDVKATLTNTADGPSFPVSAIQTNNTSIVTIVDEANVTGTSRYVTVSSDSIDYNTNGKKENFSSEIPIEINDESRDSTFTFSLFDPDEIRDNLDENHQKPAHEKAVSVSENVTAQNKQASVDGNMPTQSGVISGNYKNTIQKGAISGDAHMHAHDGAISDDDNLQVQNGAISDDDNMQVSDTDSATIGATSVLDGTQSEFYYTCKGGSSRTSETPSLLSDDTRAGMTEVSSTQSISYQELDMDAMVHCPVDNCEALFTSDYTLYEHMKGGVHNPCNPLRFVGDCEYKKIAVCYACPRCLQEFTSKQRCLDHMVTDGHKDLMHPVKVSAFACPQCLMFFCSRTACVNHIIDMRHNRNAFKFPSDLDDVVLSPFPVPTQFANGFILQCARVEWSCMCTTCRGEIQKESIQAHVEAQHRVVAVAMQTPVEIFRPYLSKHENACEKCLRLMPKHPAATRGATHRCNPETTGIIVKLSCQTLANFMMRLALEQNPLPKKNESAAKSGKNNPNAQLDANLSRSEKDEQNALLDDDSVNMKRKNSNSSYVAESHKKICQSESDKEFSEENIVDRQKPKSVLNPEMVNKRADLMTDDPIAVTYDDYTVSYADEKNEVLVSQFGEKTASLMSQYEVNRPCQKSFSQNIMDAVAGFWTRVTSSFTTKAASEEEVETMMDAQTSTTSIQIGKYTPDIIGPKNLYIMKHIIFLDLDNWRCFFQKLPRCLPPQTFVWCFYGGATAWKKPNCMAFQKCKDNNCFYLHQKCGRRKDAADFAICMHLGKMDERLPKHIPFTILSGDRGFNELEVQMDKSERRTKVINPHHKTPYELYAQIVSVQTAGPVLLKADPPVNTARPVDSCLIDEID